MNTENYNNEYSLGFNRLTNLTMVMRRKLSLYIMTVENELDLKLVHIREKQILETLSIPNYILFKKGKYILKSA